MTESILGRTGNDPRGQDRPVAALDRSVSGPCRTVPSTIMSIGHDAIQTYFTGRSHQNDLTDLRDRLKAGLSQATPAAQQAAGDTETVAELAERIKALKAAHTIEAAPERTTARKIAAEDR